MSNEVWTLIFWIASFLIGSGLVSFILLGLFTWIAEATDSDAVEVIGAIVAWVVGLTFGIFSGYHVIMQIIRIIQLM